MVLWYDCIVVVIFQGKARAQIPHFFMLAEHEEYETFLTNLNSFKGIEQVGKEKIES